MTNSMRFLLAAVALLFGASTALTAEETVPNRLATAKIGEWALYRMADGYTQKHTVAAKSGDGPEAMLTIRVDNIYDGKVVNSAEIQEKAGLPLMPPQVPEDDNVTISIKKEDVAVKGRNIPATVIFIDAQHGTENDDETSWYLSDAIPVFGIIKQVVDGEAVFELVDFGEK